MSTDSNLLVLKNEIVVARQTLKDLLAKQKEERKLAKIVRQDLKAAKAIARELKRTERLAKKEAKLAAVEAKRVARETKRTERIAKMEARLMKLKMQASRKHGKPVVYTAEQIAALNAAA